MKESTLDKVALFVLSALVWPMFFVGGVAFLSWTACKYIHARWNQFNLIKVLSNKKALEKCADKRVVCCEKQIKNLQRFAILYMRDLKQPEKLNLSIPKGWRAYLDTDSSKSLWKDISWDNFLTTEFVQKVKIPNDPDKLALQSLEEIRIKIRYLSHQKDVLSNLKGEARLEAIKRIAELSFVKNSFERQMAREWAFRSAIWLLPTGVFWEDIFNSSSARSIYEGKKEFLPSTTNLNHYADLLDAHNQLIRKHDYLVPYIHLPYINQ